MNSLRTIFCTGLLVSLLCLLSLTASAYAGEKSTFLSPHYLLGVENASGLLGPSSPFLITYHTTGEAWAGSGKTASDNRGGIREEIPDKYKARYAAWKAEFLATEVGRRQWEAIEHNDQLTLTITISNDNPNGASTGKYKWDDAGHLTAATISLDSRLNDGYPDPIYYPVMNSLTLLKTSFNNTDDDVLAATKMAHEFGHLNYTIGSDSSLYQLQSQLIPVYNKIFLTNGRKINDPRLLDLAHRMGGTPVEIWEDREYWGEANAMVFLRDKFPGKGPRCSLFSKIKQSVDLYAKDYADRFFKVAQSAPPPNPCGWQ